MIDFRSSPAFRLRHRLTLILLFVLLVLCAGTGCTEDDPIVRNIGVTSILFSHSTLSRPRIDDTEMRARQRIQAVKWEVTEALLFFPDTPDDQGINLLIGPNPAVGEDDPLEVCEIFDTVDLFLPIARGRCTEGIIFDSDLATDIKLKLGFTMAVYRAEPPFILDPMGDQDGDGVPNETDNCPLIANAGQADRELDLAGEMVVGDGIGDACDELPETILSDGSDRDSDNDGVVDVLDNCVWWANGPENSPDSPNQRDTMGLAADGIFDGIGDRCTEQMATVEFDGMALIEFTTEFREFVLPRNVVQSIFVEFADTINNETDEVEMAVVTCTWNGAPCSLERALVQLDPPPPD